MAKKKKCKKSKKFYLLPESIIELINVLNLCKNSSNDKFIIPEIVVDKKKK